MAVLSDLKPGNVWKHFEAFCNIPHPSGHEEGIAKYILDEAAKLGLATRRDDVGNVVVVQPASAGAENAPGLVLQGHMDMVGVAAKGVTHDFTKDPICCLIDGDFVKAKGTTLGADNGIGGAIMLALWEEEFPHPEIEHFFTVNEESGMDGAHGLQGDFLKGRQLINLDTEEFGEIYVSCAGGGDSVLSFSAERAAATEGAETLLLAVGGLKGGHSGADIHLGRCSGNKAVARLLSAALDSGLRIRTLRGGKKRNAISDFAEVVVDVPPGKGEAFRAAVEDTTAVLKSEFALSDGGLEVSVTAGSADALPMTEASTAALVRLLIALPHGVLAMSADMPDLVETSTNIGTVETTGDTVKIVLLTRSAVTSSLAMVKERIRTIAGFVGAAVEEPQGYPGWKPNMDSRLLHVGKEVHRKMFGGDPAVKAIHAGLECGLFSEKLSGVDMISIGPDMADVHTPDERLSISSTAKFFDFIKGLIEALAKA
jgi:dipeptidase D